MESSVCNIYGIVIAYNLQPKDGMNLASEVSTIIYPFYCLRTLAAVSGDDHTSWLLHILARMGMIIPLV